MELILQYGRNTIHGQYYYDQLENVNHVSEIEGKVLICATIRCETNEEAKNYLSKFPKYCKGKIGKAGIYKDGKYIIVHHFVNFNNIEICAVNDVTGEKNETAIKRADKVKSILKTL
jgi:hypothetical protein